MKAVVHVEQEVNDLNDIRGLVSKCNVAVATFCKENGFKFIYFVFAVVFEAMSIIETMISLNNNKRFNPEEFSDVVNHFREAYLESVEKMKVKTDDMQGL